MSLNELLKQVRSKDAVTQRKIAVLVGAMVGDAAARPLHWVYDNNLLQSHIKDCKETPEFFPESKSPFYNLPTGENSCYWDVAETSLNALAKSARYSYKGICQELIKAFGPGNPNYDMAARQEYMLKRRQGKIDGPLDGKWFNGSLVEFLDNFNHGIGSKPFGGPAIKETDGFCLNLAVVAKYADSDTVDEMSEEVIKTLSTWPTAVSHGMVASKIIAKLIAAGPDFKIMDIKPEIQETFKDVHKSLGDIEEVMGQKLEHVRAVNYVFGSPCYNPGSFQGAIHAVLTSSSYSEGVRKTIRAGGCNCSRGLFIGAMSGAIYGIEGIPVDWMEKTTGIKRVLSTALKVYT